MKQTTIPVKPDARVAIKCGADLSVEGSDTNNLVVIVDRGDSLRMREENGLFRISADSDCRVMLPSSLMLTIEKTGGDCQLSNISGRIIVGKVGCDLKLKQLGGASIESVGDECWIHDAVGAVEIARIGSNLTVNNAQTFIASSIGGDARLSNLNGKTEVTAGDEIAIDLRGISDIPEIRAKAGSEIKLYVSKEAGCNLNLISGGEEIKIHACGQDAELAKREFSLPLGSGGAIVNLTAGDAIQITDHETPEWEDEKFNWWDEDHWKNFGVDISRKVREGLKVAGVSIEHAMQQAENASREAGKQVEKAFRELDEKGFGRRDKVVGFSAQEPAQAANPKAGVSDEERLLVLKMLQDKKITVEEAEKLLNALDR